MAVLLTGENTCRDSGGDCSRAGWGETVPSGFHQRLSGDQTCIENVRLSPNPSCPAPGGHKQPVDASKFVHTEGGRPKTDRKIETATVLTESGNKLTALKGGGSGSLALKLNKAQEVWKEVPHPWFQCFSFPALCFRFTGQNTQRVSKSESWYFPIIS